jgi:hypothetical protein
VKIDQYEYGQVGTISAEEISRWSDAIVKPNGIEAVQPVSPLALPAVSAGDGPGMHAFRTAAANMGCSLLMVHGLASSSVENYNNAAALYWTFVGLWVVPGHVIEHKAVAQAVVVDVATGKIIGTATGDAHEKQLTAAAYTSIAHDKLRQRVRIEAQDDLLTASRGLFGEVAANGRRR